MKHEKLGPELEERVINETEAFLKTSFAKVDATIDELSRRDFSSTKELHRKKIQMDHLRPSRAEFLNRVTESVKKYYNNEESALNHVLSFSLPKKSDNVADEIANELRRAEVRTYANSLPPEEKFMFIKENSGDHFIVSALCSDPIPRLPQQTIENIKFDYAFSLDLNLRDYLDDAARATAAARLTCRQVAGRITKKLDDLDLPDSHSLRESLKPFPMSEHEASLMEQSFKTDEAIRERYARELAMEGDEE